MKAQGEGMANWMRTLSFLLSLFLIHPFSTKAQVSSYSFSQSIGTFTTLTGGNLVRSNVGCPPASDQNYLNQVIGFNFVFKGATYTSVGINSNGFIWFGTGQPLVSETNPISHGTNLSGSGIIDGVASAFGRALKPRVIAPCGEMRTEVTGAVGSRVFTIQFLNWRGTSLGANPVYTFQIKLTEGTNAISFVYGAFTMSGASPGTCEVGLRGSDNTDFSNRNVSSDWNSSSVGASNAATSSISTTCFPQSGLMYTWTPQSFTPCTNPPVAGTTQCLLDSVCLGEAFNLTLTGNTAGMGQTYQWQSSADNINFSAINGATNASLTSTQTTKMYYRCELSCGGASTVSAAKQIKLKKWINCYCNSGATNVNDDDIGNVSFASHSNGSANPVTNNPAATHTYTDYTNLPAITVSQGSNYPLSVSQISYGTFYPCWVNVFIDYNRDGVFDAYSERAFNAQTDAGAGNNTVSGAVEIPLNSSIGFTRMRVVLIEGGSANNSPCSAYSWGETEDYLVNIVAPLPINVGAVELVSPQQGSCFSSAEQVVVKIKNFGSNTLNFASNPLTLSSNVVGVNPIIFPAKLVNSGTLAPFTSMNIVVSNSYNMSTTGNYTFLASASVAGDGDIQNDAMPAQKRSTTVAASLPQSVNFSGYSGNNLSNTAVVWHEATGAIPGGTSSNWVSQNNLGGIGNVSARVNLFSNTAFEWMMSDNLNIENNSNLKFSVAVTNYNSVNQSDTMGSDDALFVKISTDCGATWTNLMTLTSSSGLNNILTQKTISLSAYSGQEVKIAFVACDGSIDNTNDYDLHLDDIVISSINITAVKNEEERNLEMNVYPNPTDVGNINVSVKAGNREEFLIVLLDIFGNMVYSKVVITSDNGQVAKAINPNADLPKGVYYVVGYFSDKSISKKLVIE
ncbi:MAG: T9SS type A sorting domain-containing protein [Bacteroidetes bacterium]|nr:T9SS type A sorting domain-containing protein [Bacteroidota bacterium]